MTVKYVLPRGFAIGKIQIDTFTPQPGSPQCPGHPPADDEHPGANGFGNVVNARCMLVGNDE